MKSTAISNRVSTLVLFSGPLATLLISPWSNFDPINLIKLLALSSLSFAILFLSISTWMRSESRDYRLLVVLGMAFVAWAWLVASLSSGSFSQQFWGVFGRNTGLLTYTSLAVILVASSTLSSRRNYYLLVESLVITSVPMTLYAFVQVLGLDPIEWSEKAPFATLGNINFSSAFFGMSALAASLLFFSNNNSTVIRICLALLSVFQLGIILKTGSIQGVMIYVAGLGIALLLFLRSKPLLSKFQIPYVFLGLVLFTAVSASLFNSGPLARFIFQDSIVFRFDYWYAGWMISLNNPVFGVGLDGYGDWYRELRGEVATVRTGPDRITNTAHNIYLDMSSGGGFPFLILYLSIIFLALRASMRVIRRSRSFDPYFAAIFAGWVAYLIQAGVSINQVGVGVWGWMFTGALIGYEIVTRDDVRPRPTLEIKISKKQSSRPPKQMSASAALIGIGGFAVGFTAAFVPLKADADFKKALQTSDLTSQFEAATSLGATAFHMELVLDGALRANNEEFAQQVVDEIIERYPRNFMAWRVKQVLVSSSPEEREAAYLRLKAMDPYNPEIQRVP